MQTQFGAAAGAAILAPERSFRARVLVDWNQDGLYSHPMSDISTFVESISTDRALEGSSPAQVFLIEGSSAAELKLVIAGEYNGQLLSNIFSPYNKVGPFYNRVTVSAELKYELIVDAPTGQYVYPQFIGNIRTITPDRGEATVEITALDRAEKMRVPIQLPPYAVAEEHLSYGKLDSQLVRSHWVIDHALRLCDASAADKRPTYRSELSLAEDSQDGVQLYVSGLGSYLPTVGYLDAPNTSSFPAPSTPMFVKCGKRHPRCHHTERKNMCFSGLGSGISQIPRKQAPQGIIRYIAADQDRINPSATHYIGFTINTNGPNGSAYATIAKTLVASVVIGMARAIEVYVQAGKVMTQRVKYSGSTPTVEASSALVTIPTGLENVDVLVQWDNTATTGSKVFVRAGNNTNGGWVTAGSPVTSGSNPATDQYKGRTTVGQAVQVSDLVYGTRNTGGMPINGFDQIYREPLYAADLDEGLNSFTFMPSAKKQEAWELVKEVAGAEFGSVMWDETGVFQFWNWQTMLDKRSEIVRTYTLDDVSGFRLTNTFDSVRNVYSVTTKKRRAKPGVTVFKGSDIDEFFVAGRTEKRFPIWVDNVLCPMTQYLAKYDTGPDDPTWPNWTDDVVSGYCIQYMTDDEGWAEQGDQPGVEVNMYFTTDGYLTIRIYNPNTWNIRLAKGWGGTEASAASNFGGTAIIDSPDVVVLHRNDDSIRKYGVQVLDLSGDWYQDKGATEALFDILLPRTSEPTPTTDAITVAGDPRLQLGDVIEVHDPEGFGAAIPLQIIGIRREFSLSEGLTDTLTVEVAPEVPVEDPEDPPPGVTITRRNLCPNPALANDDRGWSGPGTSDRGSGFTGLPRTTGFSVTSTADEIIAPKCDVSFLKTYRFSAYVKGSGGASSGTCQIDWYSPWGYLSSSASSAWSVTSGGVTRVATPAATAPLGAYKALLVINGQDNPCQVTGVLYEETPELRSFFDGSSAGANWDGSAGNSSSRITETV